MEPTQSGNFSVGATEAPKQQKPKNSKKIFQTLKRIIKKFWYIFSILIVVIAAVITWQVLEANKAAAWEKATDHFSRAEYEEAEALLKDLPVPDDVDKLRVYSQTMLATGHLDKSLKGYEKLYSETKDASSKLIIGNIYNQQQNYDKAVGIYREVITDNPGNVQAYVNIATVYRLQGKKDEASKVAKEAVDANPQNVTLLELRVSMLMEDQESSEFQESVAALREVNPNDPLLEALNQ
jgi:tetratricopeptide (TPR) repeat protein